MVKFLKALLSFLVLILVSTCTDTTFRTATILEPLKLLNVNITYVRNHGLRCPFLRLFLPEKFNSPVRLLLKIPS